MQSTDEVGYTVLVSKTGTPDFRQRIEQGLPLPDNPYSLLITKYVTCDLQSQVQYSDGTVYRYYPTANYNIRSETGWSDEQRRGIESSWISMLNNKVLEKIKRQSLPVVQLYVERKKTASALAKLIDESIFIARNIKRPSRIFRRYGASTSSRRYRRVRASIKLLAARKNEFVGNAWLQYRMFLTPLYHDVISSLSAAADYEKKIHTSSVSASTKFKENLDFLGSTYSLLIPVNKRDGRWEIEGGARMKVTYSITDYSLAAVSSLADPLAVGWDLVPWSFIVDRFVDLGSYLELRNATIGTTFQSGCLSYFFEWNAVPCAPWVNYYPNMVLWSTLPSGYKYEFTNIADYSIKEISTGRRVLTDFPPVTLEYPFRQGWKQITDEIVLLRQLLGRKLR